MSLLERPMKIVRNSIRTVTVVFIISVLFLFPNQVSESKTLTSTVLWEHTELLGTKPNTVLKPEIIEHNEIIYANYGNVLYVYEQSTGEELFSYSPVIDEAQYVILNIEIYKDSLYAIIGNSIAISDIKHLKLYFIKFNTADFTIDWTQRCRNAMTKYFFVQHDTIYLFNFTMNLTCCFDQYDVETGGYKGISSRIEIPICIVDDEHVLASMPQYNRELNEVWVYYFQNATEENLHSLLEIQRLDLEAGYLIDPILIPIDPSFGVVHLIMYDFFPMLQRKNLLFAEYYDYSKEKYVLIKINIFTKMIDWVHESKEVVPEIISNPSDRSTLYLREGTNAYRKINHLSTDTLQYWKLDEIKKEDRSHSQSSCVDHIIATRFIHSVVVFDTNVGEVLWVKESEKPDRYEDVAYIEFSAPIIKKVAQNTYQILYSLDDQVGLVEIRH